MRIIIYTTVLDIHKIASEDYEGVKWSVLNSHQVQSGIPNVEIQIGYEAYISLLDATTENKQLITG